MISKILPIILLLVGLGGGVGAGLALRPEPEPAAEVAEKSAEEKKEKDDEKAADEESAEPENEYVKLSNQFVIPLVSDGLVDALVVTSLSVEVTPGTRDIIFAHEPKIRDSFLQVLFDHANVGGFRGAFTDPGKLNQLRTALAEIAQRDIGDIVQDVLILEIARQDM